MIQPGDPIDTWWAGDNTVIEVLPYTGRYPQWFNCVLKITAPNTIRGWSTQAYWDEGRAKDQGSD